MKIVQRKELEEKDLTVKIAGRITVQETSGKGRLHAYSGYRRTDSDLCS